ncbi:MAG: family 16 glycosylhydrolase [Bacteroidia bacterium]|nr:family 16 glycosylhydrolase [Bacteroidia bacterium]
MKYLTYILLILIQSYLYSQGTCGGSTGDCNESGTFYLYNVQGKIRMPQEYILIFEDDFNGNKLDENYWNVSTTLNGGISDQDATKQWYTKNNVAVENGMMKIITKEENLKNVVWWAGESDFRFTSGRVDSRYQFKYDYGKFEARIKIPKAGGTWPGFWLMSRSPDLWNEIDIFEFWKNKFNCMQMSTHHEIPDDNHGKYFCTDAFHQDDEFYSKFHTYGVEWNPFYIKWYLDGIHIRTLWQFFDLAGNVRDWNTANGWSLRSKVFVDKPLDIVFTVNVHKGPYEPTTYPTDLPCEMLIDWVKVYYKYPCEDVLIDDCDNLNFKQNIFNVVYGKNIVFNCNYTLPKGYFIKLIGQNIDISKTNNMFNPIDAICELEPKLVNCGSEPMLASLPNEVEKEELVGEYLFPNPVKEKFLLRSDSVNLDSFTYEIFTSNGKFLSEGIYKNGVFIDISHFTPGVYYVRYPYGIGINRKIICEKIVKL